MEMTRWIVALATVVAAVAAPLRAQENEGFFPFNVKPDGQQTTVYNELVRAGAQAAPPTPRVRLTGPAAPWVPGALRQRPGAGCEFKYAATGGTNEDWVRARAAVHAGEDLLG